MVLVFKYWKLVWKCLKKEFADFFGMWISGRLFSMFWSGVYYWQFQFSVIELKLRTGRCSRLLCHGKVSCSSQLVILNIFHIFSMIGRLDWQLLSNHQSPVIAQKLYFNHLLNSHALPIQRFYFTDAFAVNVGESRKPWEFHLINMTEIIPSRYGSLKKDSLIFNIQLNHFH